MRLKGKMATNIERKNLSSEITIRDESNACNSI